MQNLWSKLHIRTEPSVTCSSQHHFGLLCVQGYSHTHCQLRGLSFIGTLSDLPKNCEVYIHSVCCCQTKLFFKVVGPLSLNSDQLHKFYYISIPFYLPCRKGVHTELSISTSPALSCAIQFEKDCSEDTDSTLLDLRQPIFVVQTLQCSTWSW